MKIAVISDLHLGDGSRGDKFGHEDGKFLRFLNFLEGSFEKIVLLGDIFELLHGSLPWRFGREYRRICEAHPEILARFQRPRYTYVHGNHDLAASRLLCAPSQVRLHANGTRLLFLHGHQSEWTIRRVFPVVSLFSWLGGVIERTLGHRAGRLLDDIDLTGARPGPGCPFQKWAVERAERAGADIVVTGHTHAPAVVEHGDRLFMNSGTCIRGRFNFLSIDTARGDYRVVEGF